MASVTIGSLYDFGDATPRTELGEDELTEISGWPSLLRWGAEFPVFDKVTLLDTPTDATDAATKAYVDSMASGGIPDNFTINGNLTVGGATTLTGPLTVGDITANNLKVGDITAVAITTTVLTVEAITANEITASGITATGITADSLHVNGAFSIGSKFSVDPITGQLNSGPIIANQTVLATTKSIGIPCVSAYSAFVPAGGTAGGAGMWVDHTTAVTENNLIWGSTDSSGAPVTQWGAIHLNTIGLFSTGDVAFTMFGGALWFGNLTNWQLNAPNAIKPGGGSWTAPSDARIKRDVVDYDRGLDAVMGLRPVRYRYKDNWSRGSHRGGRISDEEQDDNEYVGLVAQEAEQAIPEMVGRIEAELDGVGLVDDLRTLNTTALVFALVNACKELAARLATLEAKKA